MRASWGRVIGALVLGVPLLALLELAAVLAMAAATVHLPSFVGPGVAQRVAELPVESVLLVNASVVWLAMLGPVEIPFLKPGPKASAADLRRRARKRTA